MSNILQSNYRCALGARQETLELLKVSQTKQSKRVIMGIEGEVEIPYCSFTNSQELSYEEILEEIKEVVTPLLNSLTDTQKRSCCVVVGTSVIDLKIIESIESSNYAYKRQPYSSQKRSIDSYAKDISDSFGLHGFTLTINTACTSSANALLEASNLIDEGIFEYVVVIGLEIFSNTLSSGFNAMQLLSSDHIKPFDKQREGVVLGEAIVATLLAKEPSKWSLLGGFSNCNGVNITSVSPEGEEYAEVMQEALKKADLTAEDITLLKAHATGTFSNDIAEINAIERVFNKDIVFTAIKPYLGHTIGACGLLEMAVLIDCIDAGFVPKTLNHKDPIIEDLQPLKEPMLCSEGTFMLNYFGFGGNNTSFIIQKGEL